MRCEWMWELKNGNITFDIVENAFIHSTKGYLHWNLIITTVIVVNISVKLVSCLFIVSGFFVLFSFLFFLVRRLRHNVLFHSMVADISNAYGRHCVAFLFNSDTLYLMRTIFQAPCVIIAFSLSLSRLSFYFNFNIWTMFVPIYHSECVLSVADVYEHWNDFK